MFDSNLVNILSSRGYIVSCFPTKETAVEYILSQLKDEVIGFGGSQTSMELNLPEALSKTNKIYCHATNPGVQENFREFTAYICSVNAVAQTGEFVNIDGRGNRLSACMFGPKRLFYIIGSNKIVPNLHAAMHRAQNVAAPQNAKRLNRKTPCVVDGVCHNCASSERICKSTVIQTHPMNGAIETQVILIDQPLGF